MFTVLTVIMFGLSSCRKCSRMLWQSPCATDCATDCLASSRITTPCPSRATSRQRSVLPVPTPIASRQTPTRRVGTQLPPAPSFKVNPGSKPAISRLVLYCTWLCCCALPQLLWLSCVCNADFLRSPALCIVLQSSILSLINLKIRTMKYPKNYETLAKIIGTELLQATAVLTPEWNACWTAKNAKPFVDWIGTSVRTRRNYIVRKLQTHVPDIVGFHLKVCISVSFFVQLTISHD